MPILFPKMEFCCFDARWTPKTHECMQPLSKHREWKGNRMGDIDKGWLNSDHMLKQMGVTGGYF